MNAQSMSSRVFLRFSILLAVGLVVAACSSTNEVGQTPEAPTPPLSTQVASDDKKALIAGGANWAPLQIYDGENTTGIAIEVMQAVSKQTNYDIVFEQLPQKRMLSYFETNQIDLELASNPIWRAEYKDISVYSIPYMQTTDVVMVRQGSDFKPQSIQDFRGKRVGCTLGYAYPEFDPDFKNGTILREDAPNESNNLQKLLVGRLDAIIIEETTGLYWMKQLKIDPASIEIVYEVAKYDIQLRLHRSKESWLPALNDALKTLIEDGTIQKIVDKYTK